MARYSDDPVRHIITFRVNCEEKEVLEKMARESGRSVSDFVRRKLQHISDGRRIKEKPHSSGLNR